MMRFLDWIQMSQLGYQSISLVACGYDLDFKAERKSESAL
jgi:hypothetical protein